MRIVLLRHCEGLHNVVQLSTGKEDHTISDPVLTQLGREQAALISTSYPTLYSSLSANPTKHLILCSPFHRTVETTLLGFTSLLPPSVPSIPIIIIPQLQECGAEPCDTGGELKSTIEAYPSFLNWENCIEGWNSNEGFYEASDEAQLKRGDWVRNYVWEISQRDEKDRPEICILVSHHGFLRAINRTPKGPIWNNAEAREYKFVEGSEEHLLVRIQDAVL